MGKQLSHLHEHVFTIDPRQPQDYDAVIQKLIEQERIPDHIIHLWNVSGEKQAQSDLALFEQMQDRGFFSLVYLGQALGRQNVMKPIRLKTLIFQII